MQGVVCHVKLIGTALIMLFGALLNRDARSRQVGAAKYKLYRLVGMAGRGSKEASFAI